MASELQSTLDNSNTLTLDEMEKIHRSRIQKLRVKKRKFILFQKHYNFFTYLQEPRNRYDIAAKTGLTWTKVETLLFKYANLGLIHVLDYNPNKYMITQKGKDVIYRIEELNNLMPKYSLLAE